MATTVLNIKISEVENKIPGTSSLAATNVFNTKLVKVRIKFLIILHTLLPTNLIN